MPITEKSFEENFQKALKAVKKAEGGEVDVEARGVCQACFRSFVAKPYSKMKDRSRFTGEKLQYPKGTLVMVLHGFERPGWGHVVGECWGVGHPPFELDCTITKHWRKYLIETALPNAKKTLADLRSGKTKKFPFKIPSKRDAGVAVWGRKKEMITLWLTEGEPVPSEWPYTYPPDFASARRSAINEAETVVKGMEEDIKFLTGHIASWKYSPDALRPKEKPLTEGQAVRKWMDESRQELMKLRAPDGGPGKSRENFYAWATSFPHTLAWTAMRTGAWTPSYYKTVRAAYEKLTGAKPIEFARAPREHEVVSREEAERRAAREAKRAAVEAKKQAKASRASAANEKAVTDIAVLAKALGEAIANPTIVSKLKSHPYRGWYKGESADTNLYDHLVEYTKREHLYDLATGKQTLDQLIEEGKKEKRFWSESPPLHIRRHLRETYSEWRKEAGTWAGVKLKAL